ncbi:MAG: gluconate 2-dehydrogenase subunit 3 family protein [Archangium sp.]|nr:gluconate 2-dehydrogenase subunit 3 family protein [Archangium sp.]
MTREDELDALVPAPDGDDDITRRVFVHHLTFFGGGVVLLGGCKEDKPAAPPPALVKAPLTVSHKTFTDAEWATLSAACDRMIPRDEDPGALDAQVPEYIDRMLQTEALQQMRANFVPGVAALDRRAQRMFQVPFAQAKPEQQDELLTIFKKSGEKTGEARWYEMFVVLVMEGFLGDPSYGGNQGEVGWKLVGFNLVGRNVKGDPKAPYDGSQRLHQLVCGGGKGC